MRLWSLHPRYLDPKGLVALWRESLLARAVQSGMTKGYQHHPQLERFRAHPTPLSAINTYLKGVYDESMIRGYSFDHKKIGDDQIQTPLLVTTGQIQYEWQHLLQKLLLRSPTLYEQWRVIDTPEPHPLFRVQPGAIESWERSFYQKKEANH